MFWTGLSEFAALLGGKLLANAGTAPKLEIELLRRIRRSPLVPINNE